MAAPGHVSIRDAHRGRGAAPEVQEWSRRGCGSSVGRALQPHHADDGGVCRAAAAGGLEHQPRGQPDQAGLAHGQRRHARAVERGLARRTQEPVRNLGLDEKSFARGHNYASVVTDVDRSRVWDVTPGRKLEDAQRVLSTLSPEQRAGVLAIAMDMWPAYMSAASAMLVNADIVHDKFHVNSVAGWIPRRASACARRLDRIRSWWKVSLASRRCRTRSL